MVCSFWKDAGAYAQPEQLTMASINDSVDPINTLMQIKDTQPMNHC